jgi:reverse gyrase
MRKFILFSLLLVVTLNAFGHAGEVHNYMGTVTALHDDGSFMLKKIDGKTMHVMVSDKTAYLHADGKAARRAELTAGKRVVATISTDGKTASTIKIAAK